MNRFLLILLALASHLQAESVSELVAIAEKYLKKDIEYYSTTHQTLAPSQNEVMQNRAKMYEAILCYGSSDDKLQYLLIKSMYVQKAIETSLEKDKDQKALQTQLNLEKIRIEELKGYLRL